MKNILITGVSKGIGRTLAQHFHDAGFYIYGAYKWSENYTEEESLANSLKATLPNLTLLPCDLAERQAITGITAKLANVPLAALINNAGEFLSNNWNEFNIAHWDRSLAVTMTAPLLLAHSLQSNFSKEAAIVNIASTDAFYAAHDDIGYGASKAGLIQLTKSMAAALAPKGVRVNAVAPGWVDTDMAADANVNEFARYQTPLGRNATTTEIANVVAFLISEQSSFVNGTVMTVDGGYSSVDYVLKKEAELA